MRNTPSRGVLHVCICLGLASLLAPARAQAQCSGVSSVGCCNNNTMEYCQADGGLSTINCAALGGQNTPVTSTCVWVASHSDYECGPAPDGMNYFASDPSGDNPLDCPGAPTACIPDCNGKQCGTDGCTGSCGTCPSGDTCNVGICVDTSAIDALCPLGYEENFPCCDGNVLWNCSSGGLYSLNCAYAPGDLTCGQQSGSGGTYWNCYPPGTSGFTALPACGAACTPNCSGKVCGSDGCGGTCGSCATGTTCQGGQCVCTPNCSGKECGDNGCGGSCGSCTGSQTCNAENQCDCSGVPVNGCCINGSEFEYCQSSGDVTPVNCAALGQFCDWDINNNQYDCGPSPDGMSYYTSDPSGTYPAACPGATTTCTPDCTGKQCGTDGCGGSCGTCPAGDTCASDGMCEDTSIGTQCPITVGNGGCCNGTVAFQCYYNGTGYSVTAENCAAQPGNLTCALSGGDVVCLDPGENGGTPPACPAVCTPNCGTAQCGDDGCGGTCGTCESGLTCTGGVCECPGECATSACGTSGCPGTCGTCPSGATCTGGACELNAVPAVGCCLSSTEFEYAQADGGIAKVNCAALGGQYSPPASSCVWDQTNQDYQCDPAVDNASFFASDPSGQNPSACPGASSTCVPDCSGKQCGDDGCGGSCGTCPTGNFCTPSTGICQDTALPTCGDLGGCCLGNVAVDCTSLADGGTTIASYNCDGTPGNKACGYLNDNVGCYTSSLGATSLPACAVPCSPACGTALCGDDGCGGSCGSCSGNDTCQSGQCICTPNCSEAATCGDDGCGNICQNCGTGLTCSGVNGTCGLVAVPAVGCCANANEFEYLQADGGIAEVNCAALGPQYNPAAPFCEWDKDNLSYGCTPAADNSSWFDSDPERQNLRACPGSPAACQPDCNGKQCGDDGCGGSCGTCPGGTTCSGPSSGLCVDKSIQGCGLPFGPCCSNNVLLNCELQADGGWQVFTLNCSDLPNNATCATVDENNGCYEVYDGGPVALPQCPPLCTPQCTGKNCGDDGCGGTCGSCSSNEQCSSGVCTCTPECNGKTCGDDGCGGSCGSCEYGSCVAGACQCTPACNGKQCGPDGCGGSCGGCGSGNTCVLGQCESGAVTATGCCSNNTFEYLKNDGTVAAVNCGSLGGQDNAYTCEWDVSNQSYQCDPPADGVSYLTQDPSGTQARNCPGATSACIPDCTSKECGFDGCGGTCGTCPAGDVCAPGVGLCISSTGNACGDLFNGTEACCSGNVLVQCNFDGTNLSLTSYNCDSTTGNHQCLQTGTGYGASGCYLPGTGGTTQPPACAGLCVPNCSAAECGDDGCGGSCGTCGAGQMCSGGQCACAPQCQNGKQCGPDGCGSTCGTCPSGQECIPQGINEGRCTCAPQCNGKQCGPDGCGSTCGACPSGDSCNALGQCQCDPACTGMTCGPNGCGGVCGNCGTGQECESGQCCTTTCNGAVCGPDGCGGVCGSCGPGLSCENGQCTCIPRCNGAVCGPDGCGGECGTCQYGSCDNGQCACTPGCGLSQCGTDGCGGNCGTCPANRSCVHDTPSGYNFCECVPNCNGALCGDDGCGGTCGACPAGDECANGQCCQPNCNGKTCGDDGCGGSCGTCPGANVCDAAGACENPNCPGVPDVGCCVRGTQLLETCGQNGKQFTSCGTQQGFCGWSTAIESWPEYTCVSGEASADPSGHALRDCPACVPQCNGKSCGPDGCGGTCGTCSDTQTCDQQTGICMSNPCGLLPQALCCQGEDLVTCDTATSQVKPMNCRNQGLYCGWNQSTSSYACIDDGYSDPSGVNPQACPSSLCVPNCDGRVCGDDGCGGSCGNPCPTNFACNDQGQCIQTCVPSCVGKQCGSDGCTGTCGSCLAGQSCTQVGSCLWSNPCDGVPPVTGCCEGQVVEQCGTPAAVIKEDCSQYGAFCGWIADKGTYGCTVDGTPAPDGGPAFSCPGAPACQANCAGRTCGPDGCGGSCGACSGDTPICDDTTGQCVVTSCGGVPTTGCCSPDLTAIWTCPSATSTVADIVKNPCPTPRFQTNEQCGALHTTIGTYITCGYDVSNNDNTVGVNVICPQLKVCGCKDPTTGAALQCGQDPCGESCGVCPGNQVCQNNMCTACVPACAGKECGDDGCGGSCGSCSASQTCASGACMLTACNGVTTTGSCSGTMLSYCTDTTLQTQDCSALGRSCSAPAGGLASCVADAGTPYAYVACPGTFSCSGSGAYDCYLAHGTCANGCCEGGDAGTPITNTPPVTECSQSSCGQAYDGGCQCTASCVANGNCCSNFDSVCGATTFGSCGDGTCQAAAGEDCATCPADCNSCPALADGGPPWAVPFAEDLAAAGLADQHAQYSILPVDDVRPEGPPYPINGLEAYLPQVDLNLGNPRTGMWTSGANLGYSADAGYALSGSVGTITSGELGAGFTFVADGGGPSTQGEVHLLPPEPLPSQGSYSTQTPGGMTLAFWLQVPSASLNETNPLASGIPGEDLACGWSRPDDTVVKLACPKGGEIITGIEAYYGSVKSAPYPDGTCGTYATLQETQQCTAASGLSARVGASCIGKGSCRVDVSATDPDPCATMSTPSTFAMRAVCTNAYSATTSKSALPTLLVEDPNGGAELELSQQIESGCSTTLEGRLVGPNDAGTCPVPIGDFTGGNRIQIDLPGLTPLRSISTIAANTWTHVAFTYQPTTGGLGDLTLYVDGTLEASQHDVAFPPSAEWDLGAGYVPGASSTWTNWIGQEPTGSSSVTTFLGRQNVAASAGMDEAFLYSRALTSSEVLSLASKSSRGLLRVWPAIDAARAVAQGTWSAGGASLAPVLTPQLLDPAAAETGHTNQLLAATFSGLSLPGGTTFTTTDQDGDLSHLGTLTLAGWVRVNQPSSGTPILQLAEGGTSQISLQVSSDCGGNGVTAVEGAQAALSGSNCDHVLAAGQWAFVAYVQNGSWQSVYVDGHQVVGGNGGTALFTASSGSTRSFTMGNGVDLGWVALYNQALTPGTLESIRSTGPAMWLTGRSYPLSGGTYGPVDYAGYHDVASHGVVADQPTLSQRGNPVTQANADLTNGQAVALAAARGRLQAFPTETLGELTWSGQVSVFSNTPSQKMTVPLFLLENNSTPFLGALLNCTARFTSSSGPNTLTCTVEVEEQTQASPSQAQVWESASAVLSGNDMTDLEARVAVSFSTEPTVALAFTSASSALAVTTTIALPGDAGTSTVTEQEGAGAGGSVNGGSTILELGTPTTSNEWVDASAMGVGSMQLPAGTYFVMPSGNSASASDVRLYTRALPAADLGSIVVRGCGGANCANDNRVCAGGTIPASSASVLPAAVSLAACGACLPGYVEEGGQCAAQVAFGAPCVINRDCQQGLECGVNGTCLGAGLLNIDYGDPCTYDIDCTIDGDLFCAPDGYCVTSPAASRQCFSACQQLGMDCGPLSSADTQYGCSECLDFYHPGSDGVCQWKPNTDDGQSCTSDVQCRSGACGPAETTYYYVTNGSFLGSVGTDPDGNPTCTDPTTCAIGNTLSTTPGYSVCAVVDSEDCTQQNMGATPYTPSAPPYGNSFQAYVCNSQTCPTGFHQAWNMLSPAGCQTMYDNWETLLAANEIAPTSTWNGNTVNWLGTPAFTREITSDQGSQNGAHYYNYENVLPTPPLYAEPTMARLRQLLLGDTNPTTAVSPRTVADLKKAGAGPVLIGWAQMSESDQDAYRTSPATEGGALYLSDCNKVAAGFTNPDLTRNGQTVLTAFADPSRNYPMCVPDTNPDGSPCPTPGVIPVLQRPSAGDECESGFCAADTGVCEEGFGSPFEDNEPSDRDDTAGGNSGFGSLELVQHDNTTSYFGDESVSSDAPDGGSLDAGPDAGDDRNFVISQETSNSLNVFGLFTMPITDLEMDVSADMDSIQANESVNAELFGVATPQGPSQLDECGAVEWKDGEYQQPPTPACPPVKTSQDVIDVLEINTLQLTLPIPIGCSSVSAGVGGGSVNYNLPDGPLCLHGERVIGPVPVFYSISATLAVTLSYGAEIDQFSGDPGMQVTPGVSVGLEVIGGVGVQSPADDPGPTLGAGIKADVTILNLQFPVTWALTVPTLTYGANSWAVVDGPATAGAQVPNLWEIQYVRTVNWQATFLQLDVTFFVEAGWGPFTLEWDFPLWQFDGFVLNYQITADVLQTTKVDFEWEPQ